MTSGTGVTGIIRRALIVHPLHAVMIGQGWRTWELQSRPTRIRERIGIYADELEALVVACDLVDCIGPLSVAEVLPHHEKLGLRREELEDEIRRFPDDIAEYETWAWVLACPRRLPEIIEFRVRSRGRRWIKLPGRVSRQLASTWPPA